MQPEIAFVKKLIRMRLAAQLNGARQPPHVMETVSWLKRHIEANMYSRANEAQSFFERNKDKIEAILFVKKPKLNEEFEKLCQRKSQ